MLKGINFKLFEKIRIKLFYLKSNPTCNQIFDKKV